MNIALIAHDEKKELMVQFCIAYCGILAGHSICATNTTGRLVSEATGLKVTNYLSCKQGGDQQIGAMLANGELGLIVFLRDPLTAQPHEPDVSALLRLCDVQSIPLATNKSSATVMLDALKNKIYF